ncbi:trichothecene c-15 hydroxylase [Colletotrichum karsti]|uniref:Trichothecene c-15 hydroxylase n=1 Tax=Colletotrichum karsti TaxID=1095194 RepID=A0A9P6IF15_9PEZI|nr:trichothecene c-15 hydroxylase [Colletotrichum karsti]KAF9882293.1 trichothecene c-15 hydroxylase [Colletotrichum karsti]
MIQVISIILRALLYFSFLSFAYLVFNSVYNLLFHPLRRYPGPKLWAMSRLPYARMCISGKPYRKILELHKQYGDTVRVAPNELSYLSPQAWTDIMGHRKDGQEENGHDPEFYSPTKAEILSCDRERHGKMRRLLSHGFSRQRMREQEPIITSYVDLLIKRLNGLCESGKNHVEMTSWYNFTTFDIIGDLTFGEPFGCLENSGYHPWVTVIFDSLKFDAFLAHARRFNILSKLLQRCIPTKLIKGRLESSALTRTNVNRRLALGTTRPDFADAMMKETPSFSLSREELYENSNILINAGSETTATALSGATYFLTTNPAVQEKLAAEVRGAFSSESEIDMTSTDKLEYLKAVIEETLRAYPPLPTILPRRTGRQGQNILGEWVPPDTIIGIWQWAMYHDDRLFTKPDEFHPERWLGSEDFASDRKEAMNPFHVGPRNCLGMNLAYSELRLILARIIWNFELKLAPESRGWLDHECYLMWDKPPLNVYLSRRV